MRMREIAVWCAVCSTLLSGCAQPYFMNQTDYQYYNNMSGKFEPGRYEADPMVPPVNPRTVRDPEGKEKWAITLEEAKRLAITNNKQIAFLGIQPAEAETRIDTELAAFDATFEVGGGWGRSDTQVSNAVSVFGTGQNALQTNSFGGQSGFGTNSTGGGATDGSGAGGNPNSTISISKLNAAGGQTTLSYQLDYSRVRPVSIFNAVNPAWTSEARLTIQQPLLQGAGVEFNRSRIMIARAQHEQAIQNFAVSVQTLVRDVENAYWQLYFTYQDQYSRDTGLKQALSTWQKEKNKFIVGASGSPDVAQAREQFERFRGEKIRALLRIENAERSLRRLLGLPPEDGKLLLPKDEPSIAEFEPNWEQGVQELFENRPDMTAQRFAIRAAEVNLMRQKNGLLPDLSVSGIYAVSGLDNQFDQSLGQLFGNHFGLWNLGLRYRRPLGERAANSGVRNAQLALSRERLTLTNLAQNGMHDLMEAYQNIVANYDVIQSTKDQREAAREQLVSRWQYYLLGKATIDLVLDAQTRFSEAIRDEAQAIAQYNQAIAQWEFSKGTILRNDNVVLAEEQLSCTTDKFKKLRRRAQQASFVLPIHAGNKVHVDQCYLPDPLESLYGNLQQSSVVPGIKAPEGKPTDVNPPQPMAPVPPPRRSANSLPLTGADLRPVAGSKSTTPEGLPMPNGSEPGWSAPGVLSAKVPQLPTIPELPTGTATAASATEPVASPVMPQVK